MQGYTYSVFSIVAIVIHLMINFDLLSGRGSAMVRATRYRGFLMGVLAYYISDGAWGVLAGLGWTRALYVDTVFYFISLVAFVYMWCRFAVAYTGLGLRMSRMLSGIGFALMFFNVVMLTANVFNNCFFYFAPDGTYMIGEYRYLAFSFLIAFNILLAVALLVQAVTSRQSERGRNMMIFVHCVTMTVAIALQVVWPLTPFTSLGCLIGNCFLHAFVIREEQMANHAAKLEKALERARKAEKARSMFFSIVSHDIRTPLNAILGYSELLYKGIKTKSERDEALTAIHASGTTLLELVNDVLDLAKMDAGKITFATEPVLLSKLTDDVFASFRLTAAQKGIELANMSEDVPALLLDGHRYRQILFNLIGNAVKFTESGGVEVAASYRDGTLELSVADTGCGIAPEMQSRILDPFVQVLDPIHSADRAHGTGLGLAICSRLVKAMGGSLVVESELGKGSKFTIRVPGVSTCEVKSDATTDSDAAANLRNLPRRVLVVDDSSMNRSVLRAFLRRAGVECVDFAADGLEAFSELEFALKNGRPHDLVFTDCWMPKMSGGELVAKLRADPRFSHLPVYALTADSEFRSEQFTGILLKPLTFGRLVEVLATLPAGGA